MDFTLTRNCPICNKNITYKYKADFNSGTRKNAKCPSCRNIGRVVSPETRLKMSRKLKGRISASKGILRSSETKQKISMTLKGRKNPSASFRKGKTYEELYGVEKAESLKQLKRNRVYTPEQKIAHSVAMKNSEKFKIACNTPERRNKLRLAHMGRIPSIEARLKMSQNHADISGNKNPSKRADVRQKIRIKAIERLNDRYGVFKPAYNLKACIFFNRLIQALGINIQHAQNGNELHIKNLGYFVDGYISKYNIVLEWDEKTHYDVYGNLKRKDVIRQKEIEDNLKCKFIRIKEESANIDNVKLVIESLINNEYI